MAIAPSFDVVRVDPSGQALVAGRAAPGARVTVEVDGIARGDATADDTGGFAALFDIPSGDGARVVILRSRDAAGVESRSPDSVILASPPGLLSAAPAGGVAPGESAQPSGDGAVAAETDTAAASGAPAVLLAGEAGVGLLQPAGALPGAPSDRVTIDLITYGDGGEITLEGRTAGGGAADVHLFLDRAEVRPVAVTQRGTWRADLPPMEPGLYRISVEQRNAGGQVVSRFATPFKRESPAELARRVPGSAAGEIHASVITVQPGYSLWRIASDRYGSGMRYVQIFEANRAQIDDPDLIYPGQVFDLPGAPATVTE
ncbi:LysM peptidoglycan-binding domain-containing protein [Tropicimonas sp.]|uniref:LysM peptidoglycan-binding domain-containing protein n=1 Tax=Tropicimonas sp. TaxID=2067044 RepID=UPI003A8B5646